MSLKQLSISQLAEITGLDRKTIVKRLDESGVQYTPGAKNSKTYPAAEVLRMLLVITTVGATQDVAQATAEARLRNEIAKATKAELDLAIRQNLYLPVEEIVRAVETELAYVRSELTSIPSSIAAQLALETDASECFTLVATAINGSLQGLVADSVLATEVITSIPTTEETDEDLSSEAPGSTPEEP